MRRNNRDFVVVVVILALVVGVALVLKVWRPFDQADHPETWDPRVSDFVAFVEDATERQYEHPVFVTFQTDEEFEKEVRSDESDLDDDDKKAFADAESLGRALGLFSGATDVFEQQNDLRGSGILAYYSYAAREIVIRLPEGKTEEDIVTADDLPIDIWVTVVHELTHALQDQLYDLGELQSSTENDGESSAVLALIEGHASWVERRYVFDGLDDEQRQTYFDLNTSAVDDFEEETSEVSSVLSAAQGMPYATGPALVAAIDSDGGSDAIDTAFTERPPSAEDQVLLPTAYLDVDEPEDIDTPEPPTGETIDDGQIGAPTMYFMFATALPAPEALGLTDGWGNDAYVTYRNEDDDLCVAGTAIGDDDDATADLGRGLQAWADSRPSESQAEVDLGDGSEAITYSVCDPGPDADQDVPSDEAIAQIFGRAQDLYGVIDSGQSVESAECLVNGIYTEVPAADLAGETLSDELQQLLTELQTRC